MKMLKTEYFIARRLSKSADGRAVMARIAMISVAVSVAVMILAVAVIYGFKQEILSKLQILGSDVKIVSVSSSGSIETKPLLREPSLEQLLASLKSVESVTTYAQKGGIFKNSTSIRGVMLKGVDSTYNFAALDAMMVEGEMPRTKDEVRRKDLLISQVMAKDMQISVDDRVEMVFVDEGKQAKVDKYVVKGIYNSEFSQLDDVLCLTDIRNVQKINDWDENMISGYEVSSNGSLAIDEFTDQVFLAILEKGSSQGLLCLDMRDSYPMIFDWLKAHDVNGVVVITIMLIVAIFNMISSLLIILLERTSMIGVLKSLGMKNSALERIFLFKSASIVLRGMAWGNIVGLSLCLLQHQFGIVTLDAQGYFLSVVPIAISLPWLVGINLLAFVLICLFMCLPLRVILSIKPDITLRYK